MAITAERAGQITTAVLFGAPKSDFVGALSPEEDAFWNEVEAEVGASNREYDAPDIELGNIDEAVSFYRPEDLAQLPGLANKKQENS